MWFETLPNDKSWASLWHGYIRCECGGIRKIEGLCPSCAKPMPDSEWMTVRTADGTEHRIPPTSMGGEERYEDWIYLIMLEREWLRPVTDEDRFLNVAEGSRPSVRAIVVLVFWTYFETRIDRLYREVLKELPRSVTEDVSGDINPPDSEDQREAPPESFTVLLARTSVFEFDAGVSSAVV